MAYLLVVDDDEDFADAVATALRHDGYEVGVELNAKHAPQRVEERTPDLMIVDVMFPGDSSAGFDLVRAIRRQEDESKDIPVLMLTAVNTKFALGFSADDIDDQWLPVSDFLEKPVDFDALRKKVSALLGESGSGGD